MEALAAALGAHVRRDPCNDPVIEGRRGNIHVDGVGCIVAVMLASARQWTAAKAKLLDFCELRQNGDAEGVLHLAALPTPAQARLLRGVLRIRKRQQYSPAVLQEKRKAIQKARECLSTGALRARGVAFGLPRDVGDGGRAETPARAGLRGT